VQTDRLNSRPSARTATAQVASRVLRKGTWALAPLMVATSFVLGLWVSAWVVPFYLLLMGAVLFAPLPPKGAKEVADEAENSQPAESDRPSSEEPESASTLASDAAQSPAPKARRGRKRAKVDAEPNAATWVRIGPGKFVRAEEAQAAEGTHFEALEPAGESSLAAEAAASPEAAAPSGDAAVERDGSTPRPEVAGSAVQWPIVVPDVLGGWGGVFDSPASGSPDRGLEDSTPATRREQPPS